MPAQANHRPSSQRRWLQFQLRSLLILPVLFALAYAWTDQAYDHFLALMVAYGAIVGTLWAVARMQIVGLSHSGLRRLVPVVGAAVSGGMTIGLLAGPVMLWIALSHMGHLQPPALAYYGLSREDALELVTSGVAGSWLGAIFGMMGAGAVAPPAAYLLFLARYRAAQKGQPEAMGHFGRSDRERLLGRLPGLLWAGFCTVLLGVPAIWLGYQVFRDRVENQALARLEAKGRVGQVSNEPHAWFWMDRIQGGYGLEVGRRPGYLCIWVSLDEEDWECIRRMRSLRELRIRCPAMTDAQLAVAAAALRPLTGTSCWLNLSDTQTTDAGLKHLEGVRSLRALQLKHTTVTDVGLESLSRITALGHVGLFQTQVSPAGVARLQQALPRALIDVDKGFDRDGLVRPEGGPGVK